MVTKRSSANAPSYQCGVCGETYRDSTELSYHSYSHSEEWPHRCSYCNKGFAISSRFETHKRERNIIRNTYCRKCLKSFQGKCCPGILGQLEGRIFCESCSLVCGSSPIEYIRS
ncbi:hypothetical protein TNCT_631461 [Trichonephila clavata]|uniref:C2H2-type domain-containing protein n=1 Tax=Trichonephila clavata TaxID=2740835 RepID=A0A8X6HBU7_TRICU|nr:hypothetical protein TNCT_631461 [Trichonephila clavata]